MMLPSIRCKRQKLPSGWLGSANVWLAIVLLMGFLGLTVGVMAFRGLPGSDMTWQGWIGQIKAQWGRLTHRVPGISQGILERPIYRIPAGQSVESLQATYVTQRALGEKAILDAQQIAQGVFPPGGKTDPMPVIDTLTKLRQHMPGLEDLLLFRIAELYAAVPSEWQVQRHLTRLLESFPDSVLIPAAKYRLAESYYRSKQYVSATQWFHQLKTRHHDTPYAVGALYYLGELDRIEEKLPDAHWLEYLKKSPDGRFASYIAKYLDKESSSLDLEGHHVVGMALVKAEAYLDAVPHLIQVDPARVWVPLTTAYIKTQQPNKALALMTGQLPLDTHDDHVANAIEVAFRYGPRDKVVPWAKRLIAGQSFPRQDILYWWLAQVEPLSANQYYRALLNKHPDSLYAPASHLKLIWPTLTAAIPGAGTPELIQSLETHLTQYGYSRSAPTAAFWLAKFYEALGHKEEAIQRYRQVVRDYPYTYYGFRSAGRLQPLLHGKTDPYWTVTPQATYPDTAELQVREASTRQEALLQLKAWSQLPKGVQQQVAALAEMPSKEGLADMALLLTEALPEETVKKSAMITSWQAEANGDHPKAIRTVRDDLADLARAEDMQGYQPTSHQLRQMYPVPYWEIMQQRAHKQGLDPFLSEALMREESYFNPQAVSSSNALGLMQLLPATAQEVAGWEGLAVFLAEDLLLPETNIQLGTRYLSHLFTRFKPQPFASMLAVGAYNGGPNAMAGWVGDAHVLREDPDAFVERIPYEQTRDYIKKVYTSYWTYRLLYASP